MDHPIDLLVIGGGTAGIVGSKTAAQLGARTVLVEAHRTGGDCLWTGCVPSKTILSAAARAAQARETDGSEPDFAQVRQRVSDTIATIEPEDSPEALERAGVSVLHGHARFTGPGEAEIDGRPVRFRRALIATGSAPAVPSIPGLDAAQTATSDTVWDLTSLPARMVVLGGGPIACELGQAFARLGSQVTILARSGLLPKEDRDAAALVQASLERDGVQVIDEDEASVIRQAPVRQGDASQNPPVSLITTSAGRELKAEVILIATGRTPRTASLGLEHLGVDLDERGQVLVDDSMRTSNRSVWAAGDVTTHPKFTHLAGVHASTAASNAVLGLRRSISQTVPRITYTSPEVAAVGLTEATGPGMTTSTVSLEDTDRAVTEESREGFVRLVIDRRGRILGGTIVGPRAGESLGELSLAVAQKMTTRQLAGVTHAYPTYNDALWNAAIVHARQALGSPVVKTLTRGLAAVARYRDNHATREQTRAPERAGSEDQTEARTEDQARSDAPDRAQGDRAQRSA
ncbi:dihydrolipoyl dehydrogenase family protein [Nesterenkonia sandarakina]|uniref:Pyruvate/2-oxoglutarate dehydrogenase complex dihydrolipoamide dehydrogenase (E3) component n=1 Tax=Nesterenkonia sandarakina TaxID=272918 RepID=A0A7Z0E8U8_9MICC|nr:FAD-dependent oxidoreductase [Nesterenkonia sandarakina]NYJ17178.1 pyruvate/2-oxoglutarate dehydrogenase complex dihydrolipoamide dehydrogenase (E3) component [Nesterenkonia sandarakina]